MGDWREGAGRGGVEGELVEVMGEGRGDTEGAGSGGGG